jgi:nitroreductase
MNHYNEHSTKEAIENRRSIRKFKSETFSDEILMELLEAARLAPSGCNSQPWRFKIVRDEATKLQLQKFSYDQKFVSQAPIILVVCADVQAYLDGRVSGVQDLGEIGVFDDEICEILHKTTKAKSKLKIEDLQKSVAFNIAIAIEHIALRALDFGLGTCWMRLIDEKAIREYFAWDKSLYPVAILPIGYPDENPSARKRLSIEEIIIE